MPSIPSGYWSLVDKLYWREQHSEEPAVQIFQSWRCQQPISNILFWGFFSSLVYFMAGGKESKTYWMLNLIQYVPTSWIINTKHKQITSLIHTCKQTMSPTYSNALSSYLDISVGWRMACTEDRVNIIGYSQQTRLQAEHVYDCTTDEWTEAWTMWTFYWREELCRE